MTLGASVARASMDALPEAPSTRGKERASAAVANITKGDVDGEFEDLLAEAQGEQSTEDEAVEGCPGHPDTAPVETRRDRKSNRIQLHLGSATAATKNDTHLAGIATAQSSLSVAHADDGSDLGPKSATAATAKTAVAQDGRAPGKAKAPSASLKTGPRVSLKVMVAAEAAAALSSTAEGPAPSSVIATAQMAEAFAPSVRAVPGILETQTQPGSAAHSAVAVSELSEVVEAGLRRGVHHLRLRLHPQELGSLELFLKVGADGLHVSVRAESQAALQAVMDSRSLLEAKLGAQSLQLLSLSGEEAGKAHASQQRRGSGGRRPPKDEQDKEARNTDSGRRGQAHVSLRDIDVIA